MENKEYKTIKSRATAEFIEKKSRFIGNIAPVKNEAEALEFIREISKKHYDASHNVHAYILRDGQIKRYSDNGEPQGTAGVPSLDVLQKEGLVDICVVCTRYFGGIMLGGGGLVRAYSHTAKIAVDAAEILNMRSCICFDLVCKYDFYDKLCRVLPTYKIVTENTEFLDEIRLSLVILKERFEAFSKELTLLSNGQMTAIVTDERYGDME